MHADNSKRLIKTSSESVISNNVSSRVYVNFNCDFNCHEITWNLTIINKGINNFKAIFLIMHYYDDLLSDDRYDEEIYRSLVLLFKNQYFRYTI